jgi:cytidylate kinase
LTELARDQTLPTDADLSVIAIDGPAGSGKSTVARRLAEVLDLDYLDTGAMYRSVTYAVLTQGIAPDNEEPVAAVAREIVIDLDPDGTVVVDGEDVTKVIRSPEVSAVVSVVAANQDVRAELVARQREWARKRGGGVLDGRDIGTVVFPKAKLKVFLTASTATRAARRARDENTADEEAVAADLSRRDAFDSGRRHDPLRQAPDALVVDTSDLTVDEVVALLVNELARR